jgi:outer membrane protein
MGQYAARSGKYLRLMLAGVALAAGVASRPMAAAAFDLGDPFGTRKDIARFDDPRFHPEECPSLTPVNGRILLNLSQAVAAALCNNPDTESSFVGLMAQADSLGSAKSAWLPTASASISGSESASFAPHTKFSSKGTSSGISAGMTLFDFGQREASIGASERALEAAGYSHDATMQSVISSVLQSYYGLLTSEGNIAALRESERFATESLEAAALRFKLGLVSTSDELQARSSYAQSQLASGRGENQVRLDRARLASVLGLPPDAPLEVQDVDESGLAEENLAGKAREMMEMARKTRPDLAAQYARLEGARESLKATRRSDLPSISVSTGESFGDADIFNNSTSRSQSIGLSVSIPIFSGFSHTYSVRAAEENLKTQELAVQRAELNLLQDVWNSTQNYETAQESWMTTFDLVLSATQLRDVALGRYKEGVGTMLDLLSAQSQYQSALQSQVQARYGLLLSRVDLIRATGMLRLDTIEPDAPLKLSSE